MALVLQWTPSPELGPFLFSSRRKAAPWPRTTGTPEPLRVCEKTANETEFVSGLLAARLFVRCRLDWEEQREAFSSAQVAEWVRTSNQDARDFLRAFATPEAVRELVEARDKHLKAKAQTHLKAKAKSASQAASGDSASSVNKDSTDGGIYESEKTETASSATNAPNASPPAVLQVHVLMNLPEMAVDFLGGDFRLLEKGAAQKAEWVSPLLQFSTPCISLEIAAACLLSDVFRGLHDKLALADEDSSDFGRKPKAIRRNADAVDATCAFSGARGLCSREEVPVRWRVHCYAFSASPDPVGEISVRNATFDAASRRLLSEKAGPLQLGLAMGALLSQGRIEKALGAAPRVVEAFEVRERQGLPSPSRRGDTEDWV